MNQLWVKLSKLAKECAYVQKDGRNEYHKYSYASATSVYEKVSEAMQSLGLTSYTKAKVTELREKVTGKGGVDFVAVVHLSLFIVDVETGYMIEVESAGSGQDAGDKAVMKAQTAALKYAWMMCLNMATGDDPEADSDTDYKNEGKEKPKPEPRGPYKPLEASPDPSLVLRDVTARFSHLSHHEGFEDACVSLMAKPKCSCGGPMKIGYSAKGGLFLNCETFSIELEDCKDEQTRKFLKEAQGQKHSFHWAKPKFAKV